MPVSGTGTGIDYKSLGEGLADLFKNHSFDDPFELFKILGNWFKTKWKDDFNVESSNASTNPQPFTHATGNKFDIDEFASRLGELKYKRSGAEAANAWSERMSNTAIQRSVADMQASGFNPLLSLGGGMSGASTPSSSNPSSSPSLFAVLLGGISNIVSAAIHAASNDNRTLTMANSATALNTARILSNEGINKARLDAMKGLNNAKANYFHQKSVGEFYRNSKTKI